VPYQQHSAGQSRKKNTPLKLINLKDDIHEDNDLSKQFPEVVKKLMSLADKAKADLGDMEKNGTGQRDAGWVQELVPLRKSR
jgi:arylsulfatase A